MMRNLLSILALFLPALAFAAEPAIDYNRDVRPILSNTCFKCHGPAVQKSKLRLDSLEAAKKSGAILPGKIEGSEMIARILSQDENERMPPPDSGPALSKSQIETLKTWVKQGAAYAPHWAFVKPTMPTVPAISDAKRKASARSPIDHFILNRLETEGISPAPVAEKTTLIRRVSLDLIGLLPSPQEVDVFLKDDSANAYERLVDRLLASPHYGERQARFWLDLARYADSNGYTIDGPRSIWPYRDWVIAAFNNDMPFNQFTIEQLAGDLLPKATTEQQTATGFHRNTSFNEEGGTDAEQFRVERIIDRTNTTGAVWLGLTLGCAQCHDHKYDPVSQKEYFQIYAFLNNCDEPTLSIGGTPEQAMIVAGLQEKLAGFRKLGDDANSKKTLSEIKKAEGAIPSTLVLRERKTPRESFVQIRGDFLRKGDVVQPRYPTSISTQVPKEGTRLDLARWLVSKENPLTARVFVNRAWQQFFGTGIVETENDFGMQGAAPTHPALLDWLAVGFMQTWSVKKLHKQIVLSQTYQQASITTKELLAKDPLNKLLARQNRLRLEAEIIRDAALSASGLLTPTIGGKGVYPPLPAEVFSFTQSRHPWPESKGPDRYRRGMYTFIWRQSQHHLNTTFDGADAQTACTKRNRSNTPLQALHLANDPAFVEFAEHLGKRIEKDGPSDDSGKVRYAFRLCFAREPNSDELKFATRYWEEQHKADTKTAWARLARVLMNLDEFVTRE